MESKSKCRVDGASLNSKQFKDYVKSYVSLFDTYERELIRLEKKEYLLSLPFCVRYASLLYDRLSFSLTCVEYYRAMSKRSFWLKPFALRMSKKFEALHYDAIGRLFTVRMMIKIMSNGSKEEGNK